MKVVIINSPLFREKNDLYDEDSLPPIGLGYIATILQSNGIDVSLIDAVHQRISVNELLHELNTSKPDFLASNIFTTNYDLVKEIVENISFQTHLIIGGLATKDLYKDIIGWNSDNKIDVVTGDGELITFDIILNRLIEDPFFKSNNRRVFKVDQHSRYFVNDISDIPLNRDFFPNEPVAHPLGFIEANIVTSRGCIYDCTFCAAARSLNKDFSIRERSEASIKAELNLIKQQYPSVNSIRVLDDLFLKTRNTVQKAINVFLGQNLQWRAMAHVMTFHNIEDSIMQLLQKSGCYELFIGIESGSPKVLSSINKTKNVQLIVENLTKVFKAGINIKGYFIYGFPDETLEDMEMTFRLAEELKKISESYQTNFRTSVFQYRPYHGTQIYHDLERKGINASVQNIAPNNTLSNLVGRLQFNFHSGNYSEVESEKVHAYIYNTINLNNGRIFNGLESRTEPS
ncbi:B12-binding domain-containing radical SAM protein [Xanthocytophaga agilis]|uniref:Radical SAM protein n=1 Tax=Xanthocytophaga agilis TaxID=3048010 RepID=A0AAE3R1L1_9BACT|nr:radical SAM protein [Xanthocytophaga agilis]MDJ1502049.1 radical SAM protein [Xanthocytophaga agilis]